MTKAEQRRDSVMTNNMRSKYKKKGKFNKQEKKTYKTEVSRIIKRKGVKEK